MHNILLVGAGQIGSRHLQGLMKTSLPVRIGVVEPTAENRKAAAERASQVGQPGNIIELIFWESVNEIIFNDVSLAIIATNSDVRPEVIRQLLQKLRVHNMILEKVVFQSVKIFEEQIKLLESNKVNSLVNCPRRIWQFYKKLREELRVEEKISISVTGSNWGLGCNSLHFIDLFCFLTSIKNCNVDFVSLDREILASKRKGFVEFTGRMGFSNSRGTLNLNSLNHSFVPVIVDLVAGGRRWLISESHGNVICYNATENFKPVVLSEKFPFQSELTNLVANEILTTGECGLAKIGESLCHHQAILPLFNNHISVIQGVNTVNCPIT